MLNGSRNKLKVIMFPPKQKTQMIYLLLSMVNFLPKFALIADPGRTEMQLSVEMTE